MADDNHETDEIQPEVIEDNEQINAEGNLKQQAADMAGSAAFPTDQELPLTPSTAVQNMNQYAD